eukprot:gene4895-5977_t
MSNEDAQVLSRFVTRMPEEYRVTDTPIAVPSRITRYGLSEVVNHLLALEKPRPFDFLVDGELIRGSLEKFMLSKNVSAESVVTLEYIPAVAPPTHVSAGESKDWLSAVDGSHPNFILTGACDGCARIWNTQGDCVVDFPVQPEALTSVSWVPGTSTQKHGVVTAGKDSTAKLWEFDSDQNSCKLLASFTGHTDSIEAIAVAGDGELMGTASWDSTVRLWKLNVDDSETVPTEKKQRTTGGASDANVTTTSSAEAILEGHTGCVSALSWHSAEEIFSASWDRSVRKWDANKATAVQVFSVPKAIHCMSVGAQGALVALGGAERSVRLWDPRLSASTTTTTLTSHTAWVSAVEWCPSNSYHLVSASFDNSVKLWDIRSQETSSLVEVQTAN